ncbi:MAG: alpha-amylase [Clostridia bacterium]|nr:alpha-amylase [Clostridia bacterium]
MKIKSILFIGGLSMLLLLGCRSGSRAEAVPSAVPEAAAAPAVTAEPLSQMLALSKALTPQAPADNCGATYEIFVYSFFDSDGDGIGDLQGVEQQLPYIEDLGVSQIWLMPIFPSPTYHKYDTADYLSIDPQYGTMADFDSLLAACHGAGLRVILDLALNHTSTEHPWFQAAREYLLSLPEGEQPDPAACPYVDYYNFQTQAAGGYVSLGNGWYYEARFWSGMPDLNLSSAAVQAEIEAVAAFWLNKGVDGFRLDALTSYYTDSRPDSIAFLAWFTGVVKGIRPNAYLVGEAWTDQAAYADYYQTGIDSLFDFRFAGDEGVICSIVRGNRSAAAYAQELAAEEALYGSRNPGYINAPFYTNHDMARSAGYYAYDDGSKTKLALGLHLLMPGNAFLYYGEEIGMRGSGKDENKRAPMYWSDTDPTGLCQGPPAMDSVKMKFPPLDKQRQDPYSIYTYVKTALHIRGSFPAILRGATVPLDDLCSDTLCAFTRSYGAEEVFICINTAPEPAQIPLPEGADRLSAVLLVNEQPALLTDGVLTLPGYGVAVVE